MPTFYPRWHHLSACIFLVLGLPFQVHPIQAIPALRNPLTPIRAVDADDRSPGIKNESDRPASDSSSPLPAPPAVESTAHLANIHDGDFALYRALDFDSGVAAFQATVAGPRVGTLEIHLDRPAGPLLAACSFQPSGGWDQWQNIGVNVDHAQAGVRDVYVVFRAAENDPSNRRALVNLRSFGFLKSVVALGTGAPDLASRTDAPDDTDPPSDHAWGVPAGLFTARFQVENWPHHWKNLGDLRSVQRPTSVVQTNFLHTEGKQPLFCYTPDIYLNKTDTGGEWRTLAEGSFSGYLQAEAAGSRPGLGFASSDGLQAVYVTLNPPANSLEVWRRLADGSVTLIHQHPFVPSTPVADPDFSLHDRQAISTRSLYVLTLHWSPYSDALIVQLDATDQRFNVNFRTVVDLPAARHPLLVNSGGPASFGSLVFTPTLDAWNFRWEWLKQPILAPDVCNPAVWRGPNGQMYMLWRKFGADNFHGVAKSDDGVHWTRVTDQAIRCTGDMTVLPDPFGDGKWYATPGGNRLPWWTSDGSDDFKTWTQTDKTVGDIHDHNRIQEIIDTRRYPQLKPVRFEGKDYRFIAYCEDWVHAPQPHSVVLLSNTLTDWVQPSADPVVPPADDFWGEKGNAIGSAFPLPDGNLLLSVCACTNAGYTGAPEPTNISAVASGAEPWKLLRKATLPDAPVSRENVWYQGPNFGTAFFYDEKQDTLFFYGGFHDYSIGVMRVRNYLHPAGVGSPVGPSAE